jgi:hypothetical protein
MVAPQVPGSRAVRQPVFHRQTDGHRDDPVGVMTAGRGQVGQIGTEAVAAGWATVLGVADRQDERAADLQGTEVVQSTATQTIAIGGVTAPGAPSPAIVARAVADQRRGWILDPSNPLGGVGDIFSRAYRQLSQGEDSIYPANQLPPRAVKRTHLPCYSLEKSRSRFDCSIALILGKIKRKNESRRDEPRLPIVGVPMSPPIDERAILDSLRQVPAERWGEVLRFLKTLGGSSPIRTGSDLLESDLVGSWADRDDLGDGQEFARQLRSQAEDRRGSADAAGH